MWFYWLFIWLPYWNVNNEKQPFCHNVIDKILCVTNSSWHVDRIYLLLTDLFIILSKTRSVETYTYKTTKIVEEIKIVSFCLFSFPFFKFSKFTSQNTNNKILVLLSKEDCLLIVKEAKYSGHEGTLYVNSDGDE